MLGITFFLLLSHLRAAPGVAQASPFTWEVPVDTSEFVLKGITRNGDTGENFDHIYVDIYKILEDGSLELVRADRYPGGKFAIWLHRNERYLLKMNYNDRAFLEGLLNPANARIENDVLSQIFILDEYQPEEQIVLGTKTGSEAPPVIISEAEIMAGTTNMDTAGLADAIIPEEIPEAYLTSEEKEEETSDTPAVEAGDPLPVEETAGQSNAEETEPLGTFYVFESTSFREEATHLSDVILRFAPGNEVTLLEKTDQYWWKVRFNDKTGWVKAAKLRQDWF